MDTFTILYTDSFMVLASAYDNSSSIFINNNIQNLYSTGCWLKLPTAHLLKFRWLTLRTNFSGNLKNNDIEGAVNNIGSILIFILVYKHTVRVDMCMKKLSFTWPDTQKRIPGLMLT